MAATLNDVLTYSRTLCQTSSNGLTDSAGIAFANDALGEMTKDLLERDIDAVGTQEAYTALTTNNPNTYAWPDDMYSLKTVEVDFTGAGGQQFLQAQAVDVANIQFVSFDYLRANQPTTMPLFDNRGNTFEIFPRPTSAQGTVRIFYFKQPTDFTSTADLISYPQSLDYRCLSAKIAYFYQLSLDKGGKATKGKATDFDADYERRMNKIIKILMPPSQAPIQATQVQLSGWNF